jgi:glycerol-3-phosphate dehydrogenase (NAD(P)+)
MSKKVAVLGAGSWGTALANHIANNLASSCQAEQKSVVLWGKDLSVIKEITETRESKKYLPGIKLSPNILPTSEIDFACDLADMVVLAVPSSAVFEVLKEAKISANTDIVSAVKGLQVLGDRLTTTTTVIDEILGNKKRIGVLSGPSFASEVASNLPTAIVLAAEELEAAKRMREFFHFKNLRVYISTDVIGAELGGAIKNVIALACGAISGAGYGENARAALITRGLVEIQQLVVSFGGREKTASGLSGMGDLLLTATSTQSRNYQVGFRLGKGEKLEEIVSSLGHVAEGVVATPLVYKLAKEKNVSMPIVEQVNKVISNSSTVEQALQSLFSRQPGSE